ncbi:Oidioi.mRNA.OKI2018_I69.PAR.g8539.t1.cds [Oikopleura dioica]|uniref:Oidioi.mRNA.OKI2018_I69.PAR.g8539.t1.cds n=1 Tax=Oikopleura dioica TaxID=34765 RepID=A0ABN7RLW1_OIKDI|nr:Oidioi.mRNA.OKI2018_I69.PAR.g8539.t1.cds [Oikopleura dioica]
MERCRNWKNSVNMEKNELTRRWMQAHDNNYCGNPDKDSGGDWCYVDAPPGFCAEKCGSTEQPPMTTVVQVARPARQPSEKPVCRPRTESLFQFRDGLGAIRRPTKWDVPDQVPSNSLNTSVPQQDVLDGRSAMMGLIPWQVQLIGPAGCGGTIISSRIVITAEHCLKSPNPERWRVKAGHIHKSAFRSQNEGQIRRVAKIITTACLPPKNFKPVGGDCIISGWGKTTDVGRSSSRLLWTLIPLFDRSVCRRKLRGYSITDHMICGGGSGPDTCKGDKGGPLVCALRDNNGENQYVLAGVTSWGIGCGKTPGIYAEVADYLNWINEISSQYP